MAAEKKKTLGTAIDELIEALEPLDDVTRLTAVRAACEHLGISLSASEVTPGAGSGLHYSPPVEGSARVPESLQDIRSLREKKNPKTAPEMACLVAYYLETLASPDDRKSEITSTDLEKYFKQAGYRLPKRIDQVLIDAKAAGYFDSSGRGKYKLNPVGYNLVAHTLPRSKS